MNISPISFCKKIPINSVQVVDKAKNVPISATFYEYDCQDLTDVMEVGDLDDEWSFRDLITSGMHGQFLKSVINKRDNSIHYYCAKDEQGEMLGLCQTFEDENEISVKLIVSNPNDKYKYIGQVMLASLGKKALVENVKELKIKAALTDVYDYYETVCGFEQDLSRKDGLARDYRMPKSYIPEFIKRTKTKIQS